MCRYNAPWPLNLNGSRLYKDIEIGEFFFEPARNDDRVNSHNRYILQFWRANIDWQPVLSEHAVIRYIAKYVAKAKRNSETYHQMLMCLANIENPDDFASKVYRKLLTETIIERDVRAQATCHMLLELPLVECNRKFVNLNVSQKNFKPVTKINEGESEEPTESFIDAYKRRPNSMETFSLIHVSRSWIHNKNRKNENKWKRRQKDAIVRVYPRFVTIPPREFEKFIEFCFSELLLYKPFIEIEIDIGEDSNTIISNWDSFNYVPWHVK